MSLRLLILRILLPIILIAAGVGLLRSGMSAGGAATSAPSTCLFRVADATGAAAGALMGVANVSESCDDIRNTLNGTEIPIGAVLTYADDVKSVPRPICSMTESNGAVVTVYRDPDDPTGGVAFADSVCLGLTGHAVTSPTATPASR